LNITLGFIRVLPSAIAAINGRSNYIWEILFNFQKKFRYRVVEVLELETGPNPKNLTARVYRLKTPNIAARFLILSLTVNVAEHSAREQNTSRSAEATRRRRKKKTQ
jgi:hypothetical protein